MYVQWDSNYQPLSPKSATESKKHFHSPLYLQFYSILVLSFIEGLIPPRAHTLYLPGSIGNSPEFFFFYNDD